MGKSAQKILHENPRQNPPKIIQQKSPTHFCRGAGPRFSFVIVSVRMVVHSGKKKQHKKKTKTFWSGFPADIPDPYARMPRGQKVSPHHRGRRKTHFLVRTSTIFGTDVHDPEGPARHLDASRQKLTPHCLAAIFDSQLPSPKLSPKMPRKLPLPHNGGHFFLFQNCPRGEGNCAAIERQKLSRGNFCPAASRCLSGPSGDPKGCRKTLYKKSLS